VGRIAGRLRALVWQTLARRYGHPCPDCSTRVVYLGYPGDLIVCGACDGAFLAPGKLPTARRGRVERLLFKPRQPSPDDARRVRVVRSPATQQLRPRQVDDPAELLDEGTVSYAEVRWDTGAAEPGHLERCLLRSARVGETTD